MSTTYTGAKDAMLTLVNNANENQTITPYIPEIRFQGVEQDTKPESDKYWLRVEINTLVSEQKTLSSCVTAPGKRMYIEAGLIVLELYFPKVITGSWPIGQKWAEVLRGAFRGVKTANGVWFRNAVIKELDSQVEFLRINVIAEFNYSEIQ